MVQIGQLPVQARNRVAYKPTPRNLRYFASTPYARRAINAYKNTICQLDWEIVVAPGFKPSDDLSRQMEIVKTCFDHPNDDDDFSQLLEQLVEDMCLGAGAIEQQIGGNALRPLWMYPVDGLSIQIYPMWDGSPDQARYVQMMGYGSWGGDLNDGVKLRNDELIYIRPNPNTGSPFGLGPLEVAFMTVSRLLGVADYAGNLSSNNSPAGMLWLGDVDDDATRAFRQYWKNDIEGQGRMPISGGGEKKPEYVDLHPQGDTALYLKYQDFLKNEVAVAFDLSPQNLGIERDVNRNTSEVAADRDTKQAVAPFGKKIGRAFTRETIHQKLGFYGLEFRFKGLNLDDELNSAHVYEAEYKNNATTPNEYRALKGRPPMTSPWGDLTFADFQVAVSAARGAKAISDADSSEFDGKGGQADVIPNITKALTPPAPATPDRISTDHPPRSGSTSPTK